MDLGVSHLGELRGWELIPSLGRTSSTRRSTSSMALRRSCEETGLLPHRVSEARGVCGTVADRSAQSDAEPRRERVQHQLPCSAAEEVANGGSDGVHGSVVDVLEGALESSHSRASLMALIRLRLFCTG